MKTKIEQYKEAFIKEDKEAVLSTIHDILEEKLSTGMFAVCGLSETTLIIDEVLTEDELTFFLEKGSSNEDTTDEEFLDKLTKLITKHTRAKVKLTKTDKNVYIKVITRNKLIAVERFFKGSKVASIYKKYEDGIVVRFVKMTTSDLQKECVDVLKEASEYYDKKANLGFVIDFDKKSKMFDVQLKDPKKGDVDKLVGSWKARNSRIDISHTSDTGFRFTLDDEA